VPVSSTLKGANSEAAEGHLFDYPALEFVIKDDHENFDCRPTRIFGGKPAVSGLVPKLRSAGNSKLKMISKLKYSLTLFFSFTILKEIEGRLKGNLIFKDFKFRNA